jgi:hypothetical protein
MKLSERIAADEITCVTVGPIGMSSDGMRYTWSVCLFRPDGRTLDLAEPFESNEEPDAFEVLDLVSIGCSMIDQSHNWRSWQREWMPPARDAEDQEVIDSLYPEHTYETWTGIDESFLAFLGHQGHHDYLYDTDRSS